MTAYYNEFDPKAAAWLRELIKRGLIADGIVDERSITEVTPDDVRGFDQCHWFAGIGGWSYSLRIAGIPDDYPVWTASLPCQPFSSAGKQLGKADERHLLPYFLELVRQCRPSILFGEQVPGAIRHGWLDDLYTEMEASGYAVGAVIAGAHSVGAPHIRQRLYWVANTNNQHGRSERLDGSENSTRIARWAELEASCAVIGMGYTELPERRPSDYGRSIIDGQEGERLESANSAGEHGAFNTWANPEWLYCQDNKYRPVKPGLKPLVARIPGGVVRGGDNGQPINANETAEARVMRLKGYGNAIVPQVAAEFISAFMEVAQ